MRISAMLLALSLLPSSARAQPLSSLQQRILDNHNRERAAVGSAPLRWNVQLERDATEHARLLARTGRLVHAPREGRGNVRENLSRVPLGWGPDQMMWNWLSEKRYFHGGIYPNVCTGGWSACAHYTQVIWPGTTDLGCGMAAGGGFNWFVCRYSPGGNKDGRRLGVAAYGSPRGMGPTDSAKSRQRLGTPGQSHRRSNLEVLCKPRVSRSNPVLASDVAGTADLNRWNELKAEAKRIQKAIAALQAQIADYDPSLIEELLGTAQAPPLEQMRALTARLKEVMEEMSAIHERVLALLEKTKDYLERLRIDKVWAPQIREICRDRDYYRQSLPAEG